MAPAIIAREIDEASPTLFNDCAAGTVLSSVTLYVQPITVTGDALTIQLTNAIISNVSREGHGTGRRPTENVTFVYAGSKVLYTVPKIG